MQVTTDYVEQVCRANCIPPGYKYTAIAVSIVKRALADDMPAEYRLKFLDYLDRWANADRWLTADTITAITAMSDAGYELYCEAAKLDRGKPGQPAMFDALAQFFPAFAVLNPTLLMALELRSPIPTTSYREGLQS